MPRGPKRSPKTEGQVCSASAERVCIKVPVPALAFRRAARPSWICQHLPHESTRPDGTSRDGHHDAPRNALSANPACICSNPRGSMQIDAVETGVRPPVMISVFQMPPVDVNIREPSCEVTCISTTGRMAGGWGVLTIQEGRGLAYAHSRHRGRIIYCSLLA